MKQFNGFPARMEFTPIPNLFLGSILPQIDDIFELKMTLFIFWALHRKRGHPRFVTYSELLSNRSLMNNLRETSKPPAEVLRDTLEVATKRVPSFISHWIKTIRLKMSICLILSITAKLWPRSKAVSFN